jgi:hypothetical protein
MKTLAVRRGLLLSVVVFLALSLLEASSFFLCGCHEETSPLRELMKAVQGAEATASGSGIQAQKTAVADVAKRVFSNRRMEDFFKDSTDFGNQWQKVEIRDGAFIVTGHNYWWTLTPVLEGDYLREVSVQATPICAW